MTPSMFDQMTARGAPGGVPQVGLDPNMATDPFPKFGSPGSNLFPSYPPTTPFGMLQQQALRITFEFGRSLLHTI